MNTNLNNFDVAILPKLSHECGSNNCTFQDHDGFYSSLGFRSQCHDLSANIHEANIDQIWKEGDKGSPTMEYTLQAIRDSPPLRVKTSFGPFLSLTASGPLSDHSSFFSFWVLMIRDPTIVGIVTAGEQNPGYETMAYQCDFTPILKQFNAVSVGGLLDEVEISRQDLSLMEFPASTASTEFLVRSTSLIGFPLAKRMSITGPSEAFMTPAPLIHRETNAQVSSMDLVASASGAQSQPEPALVPDTGPDSEASQHTSIEIPSPTSIFLAAPDPLTGSLTPDASSIVGVAPGGTVLPPSIALNRSSQEPPQHEPQSSTNVSRDYILSLSEVHVNGETISCETATTQGTNNSFHSRDPSNITQYYDPRCVAFLGQDAGELLRTALWFLFPRHDMSSLAINVTGQSIPGLIRTVDNLHLFPLYDRGQATLESVNAYAARVADTMSAFVRAAANKSVIGNAPSVGVARITRTCASVAWPWLSLPAALTVSTIVFLGATVVHTRHHSRNPLWPGLLKSSPLGILLHGPSDDTSFDHYAGQKDLVVIEHAADGVRSSLQRRYDG